MKNFEVKYLNKTDKELFDLVKDYIDQTSEKQIASGCHFFEELITFLIANTPIEVLEQLAQDLELSFLIVQGFNESVKSNNYGYIYYSKQGKIELGSFFEEGFNLEKFDYKQVEELKSQDFEFVVYED